LVNRRYSLKWLMIWLATAAALAAMLTGGMLVQQIVADGGWVTLAAHAAQVAPGVFDVESASEIPPATNLTPLKTFWKARQRVLNNYVYPEEIDDAKLTYGAIKGMLSALGDPYTRFMTPEEYAIFQEESEGHFEGIGAYLEMQENAETKDQEVVILSVIPGGPAAETELRAGDAILLVDERLTKGLPLDEVVKLIKGKSGTKVKLTVRHQGEEKLVDVDVVRRTVDVPIIEAKMLDDEVGYIWLQQFNRQAEMEVRDGLEQLKSQGMKALLLDLSGDPGGMLDMAVAVASLFLDDTPITWIEDREGEPEAIPARGGIMLDGNVPIVVLIDAGSASASEIVAGALQDIGRATVVGQPSFGKAKVQTVMEMDDGSALVLTTAVYLTPAKRDISKEDARGVQPDVRFPDPPQPWRGMDADQRQQWQKEAEQWREQQIARAAEVLREKMAAGDVG